MNGDGIAGGAAKELRRAAQQEQPTAGWRLLIRASVTIALLLASIPLAHAQELEERTASRESMETGSEPSESRDLQHGIVTRFQLDVSAARLGYQYEARYDGTNNGSALYVNNRRSAGGLALGGRLEVGYSISKNADFGFYPRGGLILGRVLEPDIEIEGNGQTFVLSPLRYLGAATVGGEVQFYKRSIGVALDLGLAGSHIGTGQASSPELHLESRTTFGALLRASALWRFPPSSNWGAGLLGFVEGSAYPGGYYSGLVWTTRMGAAVFIEWDGGRK